MQHQNLPFKNTAKTTQHSRYLCGISDELLAKCKSLNVPFINPTCLNADQNEILADFLQGQGKGYFYRGLYELGQHAFVLMHDLCWRERKAETLRSTEEKVRIEGDRYEVIDDKELGRGEFGVVRACKGTLILTESKTLIYKNREEGEDADKQRVAKIQQNYNITYEAVMREYQLLQLVVVDKEQLHHPKKPFLFDRGQSSIFFMRRVKGERLLDITKNHCIDIHLCVIISKALLHAYIIQIKKNNLKHGDLGNLGNIMVNLKNQQATCVIIDLAMANKRNQNIDDLSDLGWVLNQIWERLNHNALYSGLTDFPIKWERNAVEVKNLLKKMKCAYAHDYVEPEEVLALLDKLYPEPVIEKNEHFTPVIIAAYVELQEYNLLNEENKKELLLEPEYASAFAHALGFLADSNILNEETRQLLINNKKIIYDFFSALDNLNEVKQLDASILFKLIDADTLDKRGNINKVVRLLRTNAILSKKMLLTLLTFNPDQLMLVLKAFISLSSLKLLSEHHALNIILNPNEATEISKEIINTADISHEVIYAACGAKYHHF